MGGYRYRSIMCLPTTLVLALVLMISSAEAQSIPSCANDLIPCADFLNSTNPPASCCNPLKQTVAKELTCLCNLFYTPGLLQGFNISVDQALQLSRRCGVTSDLSSCKNGTKAPSPASGAPPVTPGSDKGGAGRVSFSGLSFLFLVWASMSFN